MGQFAKSTTPQKLVGKAKKKATTSKTRDLGRKKGEMMGGNLPCQRISEKKNINGDDLASLACFGKG